MAFHFANGLLLPSCLLYLYHHDSHLLILPRSALYLSLRHILARSSCALPSHTSRVTTPPEGALLTPLIQ